jgi:hypothetical protein
MGEARRMCLAMREAEENGISGAMQTVPLAVENRVETDFSTDLGDRNASASSGVADSVAHELSYPAVAAPAGRTAIRRI